MRLTKHHGLGNDFLVLVDLAGEHSVDADLAVAVCDRHRGIGADGLLSVTRSGSDDVFRMVLHNEDGSRAEMSGNGISCLAQALVLGGHAAGAPDGAVVEMLTDAGPRSVEVETVDASTHRMRVAMGTPTLEDERSDLVDGDVLAAVTVGVGNPHVVCRLAPDAAFPDIATFGRVIDAATSGGTNVEIIRQGTEDGTVDMVVYERGVGPTQACGTGAVASALAARHWGLARDLVTVAQPGGQATVEIDDRGGARLTVPVVAVATIEWPW